MYRVIEQVSSRSGKPADLGLVTGPDPVWRPRIRRLLRHVGNHWSWQLDRSLTDADTGTSSRFYLLSRGVVPFATAVIVERKGIGILGHVYTIPQERRQGAASRLLGVAKQDHQERRGRALSLRTGFETPAFRMYRRHGFVEASPGAGSMYCFTEGQEAFEREVFAPGLHSLEPLTFRHWPLLPALAMCRHPARARIQGMDAVDIASPEEGSLAYLVPMSKGARSHYAHVAVSCASQVPVGIAALAPAKHHGTRTDLVDAFAAPGHEDCLEGLLAALPAAPGRRQVACTEPAWPVKASALRRAGFLPCQGERVLERVTR